MRIKTFTPNPKTMRTSRPLNAKCVCALTTFLLFFSFSSITGQCEIGPGQNMSGVYPPAYPNACVGDFYSHTATIVLPRETIVTDPPIVVPGFIDSIKVTGVILPAGLALDCETPNCFTDYTGSDDDLIAFCVAVSGTPTATFNGQVTVTINVSASSFDNAISESNDFPIQLDFEIINGGNNLVVLNTSNDGDNSFRSLLNGVCSNDMLTFDADLAGDTIRLTGPEIFIEKPFSITGLAVGEIIISGENNSSIFEFGTSADVTLENLTLAKGHPTEGVLRNFGKVNMVNVVTK